MNETSPVTGLVTALAERVLRRPATCGACRVVAVDGYAGAGKTTFAGRLAVALGGDSPVPVVHTDEFASHDDFFGWDGQLVARVLEPLRTGRAGGYSVYDWVTRTRHEHRRVPAAPAVVVEGVGAARRSLLPYLSAAVWLDVPAEVASARGMRRDGPALRGFWDEWLVAQEEFLRVERPWRHAEPVRP